MIKRKLGMAQAKGQQPSWYPKGSLRIDHPILTYTYLRTSKHAEKKNRPVISVHSGNPFSSTTKREVEFLKRFSSLKNDF